MATYKEIQDHIRRKHGFVAQTCWIADVKSELGLTTRIAPNRQGTERVKPCPAEKRSIVLAIIRELESLD